MKAYRLLLLLLLPSFTYAQASNGFGAGYNEMQNGFSGLRSFFNVVNSEPITAPGNPHQLNGSPYFSDTWMKGVITLSDGKSYRGEMLRLDLLNTKLLFVNNEGREKVCVSQVDRIILLDSVNSRAHTFVHSFTLPVHPDLKDSVWLEVMQPGKAQLIKYQKKDLVEKSSYASAPEDVIKTQVRYYLLMGNRLYKVSSFRDLRDIFVDRKPALDAYINKQNLSWKNEADIIGVVAYFNSLTN
jgi:hypothetical protein